MRCRSPRRLRRRLGRMEVVGGDVGVAVALVVDGVVVVAGTVSSNLERPLLRRPRHFRDCYYYHHSP